MGGQLGQGDLVMDSNVRSHCTCRQGNVTANCLRCFYLVCVCVCVCLGKGLHSNDISVGRED